jgi:hypothetical protein
MRQIFDRSKSSYSLPHMYGCSELPVVYSLQILFYLARTHIRTFQIPLREVKKSTEHFSSFDMLAVANFSIFNMQLSI